MKRMTYEERLEAYRLLREEHPDEPLHFFAEHFDVHIGTVSRWNKALKKQTIKEEATEELEERLRKEYEAKLQALWDEKEHERAERARKKREAEGRASEHRRAHFKCILDECPRETVVANRDEDITWQGFPFHIKGGVPTEVPEVIAGVLRDAQKARKVASRTIARYTRGQYLGKI